MAGGELHALLVGIDRYESFQGPGAPHFRDLNGCVADVARMERWLRTGPLELPEERIRKLVSPSLLDVSEPPPPEDLPTYRNLIEEIRALGRRAREAGAGQVLLFHSGHGARVESRVPRKRAMGHLDEALVPCDAAASEGGFLRDVEIHRLLSELSGLGLRVIVILDACHSGGATRGPRGPRGPVWGAPGHIKTIGTVHGDRGPLTSPLGSWEELAGELGETELRRSPRFRHVAGRSGWFPPPERTVLLAACLQTEYAKEYLFEGSGWGGALTHFLLEAVRELDGRATYRRMHHRLLGRIRGAFQSQTPVLEGDGDSYFPGSERLSALPRARALRGIPVLEIEPDRNDPLLLGAGRALGLGAGARLRVRSEEPAEGEAVELEVTDPGATTAWARVVRAAPGGRGVAPGDLAEVIDPGASTNRRPVGCLRREGLGESGRRALERLQDRLAAGRSPRLAPWNDDGSPPDFLVEVTEQGTLRILDGSGVPLLNQGEPLPSADDAALDRLVGRLDHLARFRDVRDLANPDAASGLAGRVQVDLFAVERRSDCTDPASREPVAGGVVPAGTLLCLPIQNLTDQNLSVVVLDLQPDWGISIAHPRSGEGSFALVEAGKTHHAFLSTSLPEGLEEGLPDYLKVIAATDTLDATCLLLAPLTRPPNHPILRSTGHRDSAAQDLRERLLRPIRTAGIPTRSGSTEAGSHGWIVESVEIKVLRASCGASRAPDLHAAL